MTEAAVARLIRAVEAVGTCANGDRPEAVQHMIDAATPWLTRVDVDSQARRLERKLRSIAEDVCADEDPATSVAFIARAVGDNEPATRSDWPELDRVGFGLAGTFAEQASEFTEADPVGILFSVLAGVGACIGSGPHSLAGNDRHPAAIWPVLLGKTAKGGKGTADAVARSLLRLVDPDFFEGPTARVLGGFGSGEAVIDEIRDPDGADEGARDKRVLVREPEFARFLRIAGREGSILSMVARQAWDGQPLQARSRANKVAATGYHVVVIGHGTADELRLRLSDAEVYGGLGNRFLWCAVRRTRRFPAGGNVPEELCARFADPLRKAVDTARRRGLVVRTPAAESVWADVYDELAEDEPGGLVGALTARDAPQCLRLSLLLALLEGSPQVDVEHVEGAAALWRYCRATVEMVWGDKTGNPDTDVMLDAIRKAGDRGITSTELSSVFGRHRTATQLAALGQQLIDRGLVHTDEQQTDGRPRTVWLIGEQSETSE